MSRDCLLALSAVKLALSAIEWSTESFEPYWSGGTAMAATSTVMRSPAHAKQHELFVVATHKVRDRDSGVPHRWLPYGVQHAWAPGSRRTLCGEWINDWEVFWDLPFSARPSAACPACVEATLPEEARRRLDRIDSAAATG